MRVAPSSTIARSVEIGELTMLVSGIMMDLAVLTPDTHRFQENN
jgi:hypothetical protein